MLHHSRALILHSWSGKPILLACMQCGCQCIECRISGPDGTLVDSTDPADCSTTPDFSPQCTTRNETNCGLDFSDSLQAQYCAIEEPTRWAPVFDLGGSLFTLPGGDGELEEQGAEFIYLGETTFGEEAMQRFVRVPDLQLLNSSADVAADVAVRPPKV